MSDLKIFEAELEIVNFDSADIITTSPDFEDRNSFPTVIL